MRPVRSVARAMLGAIFIASGARSVTNPDALVKKAERVTERVAPILERVDPRLPTDTRRLIQANGATQVLFGTMFAAGRFTRPSAVILAATLVPTTLAAHAFWLETDPDAKRTQRTQFLKNLGLMGGLLLAAADTEGRPSLGWRARHLVDHTQRSMGRTLREAKREAKVARRAAAAARRLPR